MHARTWRGLWIVCVCVCVQQVHTALGQLLLLKSCHRAHILKWELSMSIQTVQVAASHLMPLGAHLGMG
eukprot:scaffold124168_cov22-Tisochrysis_lutea.AAC.1